MQDFKNLLSEVLGYEVDFLKIDHAPKDIDGWDSVNHVFLIMKLEDHYNIKFNTSQVQKWKCVGDIIEDIELLKK